MDNQINDKLQQLPNVYKIYLAVQNATEDVQEKINHKYHLSKKAFLYVIFTNYNPGLKQETLSNFLGIDKSTVGRVIDELVEKELLIRKQDPKNKRANNIFITTKGDKLNKDVLHHLDEWMKIASQDVSVETKLEVRKFLDEIMKKNVKGFN